MMHSRFVRLLTLSVMSLAATVAQVDTGTISGIVTDSTGAIMPGASVTVTQLGTNVRTTLSTNDSGFYSAPGLRSGRYDVAVSKTGFQAQRATGVELRVQDRLEINFSMAIGATST